MGTHKHAWKKEEGVRCPDLSFSVYSLETEPPLATRKLSELLVSPSPCHNAEVTVH